MSLKHPVISVVGSSGAGTSTVKHTFDQIFRRDGMIAATALATSRTLVTGNTKHFSRVKGLRIIDLE